VTYVSLAEVASFIAAVTGWEGFAASVATKLFHKNGQADTDPRQ
jgi:hypothetical protein